MDFFLVLIFCSLIIFLFLDVFFNSIIPSFQGPWYVISILFILQIVSIVVIGGIYIYIISQTFSFKVGMFLGVVKLIFITFILYFLHIIFITATNLIRIVKKNLKLKK
jgi:cytochrome c biogenesis protein CcdA